MRTYSRWQTAGLTAAAMVGFAANSVLARAALGTGAADAPTFTFIRIGTGALVLALVARAPGAAAAPQTPATGTAGASAGSWSSALALFAYAAAFSYAYLRLPTGTGALILFGAVQATMVGAGLVRGERPRPAQWFGLALALGGLVLLTFPGIRAPAPAASALMALAGIAWGVYSLRGRAATRPVAATAGNFLRAIPFAAVLVAGTGLAMDATRTGFALAAASGAFASGLGYSLWYGALPSLTRTQAAVVQLCVPVLAAVAGVVLLREEITARLVIAGLAILGGVFLAVRPPR